MRHRSHGRSARRDHLPSAVRVDPAARRSNRYEAVITFAPLPVEGGTGSPVNPLVTF
jgi:hypothetical protein